MFVVHEGRHYSEGEYISLSMEVTVKIEHITEYGFLYNHSPKDDSCVTVVDGDGKTSNYYKNWDILKFVNAEIIT